MRTEVLEQVRLNLEYWNEEIPKEVIFSISFNLKSLI